MRIRRVGLIVAMLLVVRASTTLPTTADTSFESIVNAATIPHTFDSRLHDIAHQRAIEIVTDFSHAGIRPGTAEVLAWSSGKPDPLAWAVSAWLASPPHLAVLTDARYELLGCGIHSVGNATYAACVLSAQGTVAVPPPVVAPPPRPTPEPAPAPAPTPPVQILPDAAMRTP